MLGQGHAVEPEHQRDGKGNGETRKPRFAEKKCVGRPGGGAHQPSCLGTARGPAQHSPRQQCGENEARQGETEHDG